jgi:methionyl-tRNA formyltransferase
MPTPLRIVFLGSDPIALPLLNWLAGEGSALGTVVAIFTQPDRAAGRGQNVQPNAIKTWATERRLPVFQPEKITEDVRSQLLALRCDLGLVMAYGHILRDDFIGTPRLGMLNLHTSLLPKYRGASPIQTAIASGERITGVSLMRIIRRLDAGPIGGVEGVTIHPLDTAAEVEARLAQACVLLMRRALPRLAASPMLFTAQDESAATYCRKLTKDDGVLDFTQPAHVLAARVNGLFPWPACGTVIQGQAVRLGLADVTVPATGATPPPPEPSPGEVIGADADGLLVATGAGTLRLRKLQRAGGRMLPAAEFLRGFPVTPGVRLTSHPMPPLLVPR